MSKKKKTSKLEVPKYGIRTIALHTTPTDPAEPLRKEIAKLKEELAPFRKEQALREARKKFGQLRPFGSTTVCPHCEETEFERKYNSGLELSRAPHEVRRGYVYLYSASILRLECRGCGASDLPVERAKDSSIKLREAPADPWVSPWNFSL